MRANQQSLKNVAQEERVSFRFVDYVSLKKATTSCRRCRRKVSSPFVFPPAAAPRGGSASPSGAFRAPASARKRKRTTVRCKRLEKLNRKCGVLKSRHSIAADGTPPELRRERLIIKHEPSSVEFQTVRVSCVGWVLLPFPVPQSRRANPSTTRTTVEIITPPAFPAYNRRFLLLLLPHGYYTEEVPSLRRRKQDMIDMICHTLS